MARADIATLLSLDQYAQIIGADPRHFNQLTCTAFPELNGMKDVWYQQSWMRVGHASRQDVARSIAEAEYLIAEVMGMWPAPMYIEGEVAEWRTPRLYAGAYPPTSWPRVFPKWRNFVAGGWRAASLVADDVDISLAYQDLDGDGWKEVISFSEVITGASGWPVSEIGIYAHGDEPNEANRIRFLQVKIASDDTVTIFGQAPQFVLPALWSNKSFIDGDDPSVFLQSVDIYRVYTVSNDTNPGGVLRWFNPPALTQEGQFASLGDYNPISASVAAIPVAWSATLNAWVVNSFCSAVRRPTSISLNYLSGFPLTAAGTVHPTLATAIAALATARLTSPISGGGESIEGIFPSWQEIPEKNTYPMRECPFGIRYGSWQAWQTIRQFLGGYDSVSL